MCIRDSTDINGIFEFDDLDPHQKYDLAVNTFHWGDDEECGSWQRMDTTRLSTVLYDIELADSGDGWFTVDIRLLANCPDSPSLWP